MWFYNWRVKAETKNLRRIINLLHPWFSFDGGSDHADIFALVRWMFTVELHQTMAGQPTAKRFAIRAGKQQLLHSNNWIGC